MKRCASLVARRYVQPLTKLTGRTRSTCISMAPFQLRSPVCLGQHKAFVHVTPVRWAQNSGSDSSPSGAGDAGSLNSDDSTSSTPDNVDENEGVEQKASEEASEDEVELSIEEQLTKANERVTEIESELANNHDRLLRTLAEMENVRMISKRDVTQAREYANQSFAKGLLDVADNLQRALESVGEEDVSKTPMLKTLVEGVQMTDKELKKIFKKNGISQYGEIGEKFDPNLHNALFQYPDATLEAGSIGQVIKTGFKLKDRVIRPADVGTIKAA